MVTVSIALPSHLVEEARRAGLDISAITEAALRDELAIRRTADWLADVARLPPVDIPAEVVRAAVRAAKDELEHG